MTVSLLPQLVQLRQLINVSNHFIKFHVCQYNIGNGLNYMWFIWNMIDFVKGFRIDIVQAWHVIGDKSIKAPIQFRLHLQYHNKVSPIGNGTHHDIK